MVQLVRFSKGKKRFEVMTKDGSVRKFRNGKLGWGNVLVADQIFTDSKKGNVAKSKDLHEVFGTDDLQTCLRTIVTDGDLQISAEERKEDFAAHRRKVIAYIHKTYVDGGNLPHPISRLEAVIDEAKVRLDPRENPEKHGEDIVSKLRGTLVFKKNTVEYTIIVGHAYAKKAQGVVYKLADVRKESWDAEGCTWILNVPNSQFDGFLSALNKLTQGDFTLLADGQKPPSKQEKDVDGEKARQRKKDRRKKKRERLNRS